MTPPKRRGVLAGLLGAPVAAKAMAERGMADQSRLSPPLSAGYDYRASMGHGGLIGENQMDKAAVSEVELAVWDRFRKAKSAVDESHHRRMSAIHRAGGVPFHLASMQSCKPWFIAQRAEAWFHADEMARRSFAERLEADILGHVRSVFRGG